MSGKGRLIIRFMSFNFVDRIVQLVFSNFRTLPTVHYHIMSLLIFFLVQSKQKFYRMLGHIRAFYFIYFDWNNINPISKRASIPDFVVQVLQIRFNRNLSLYFFSHATFLLTVLDILYPRVLLKPNQYFPKFMARQTALASCWAIWLS